MGTSQVFMTNNSTTNGVNLPPTAGPNTRLATTGESQFTATKMTSTTNLDLDNLITNLEFKIAFAETNLRYIASEPLYAPRREELREFNLKVIEDAKRELAEIKFKSYA